MLRSILATIVVMACFGTTVANAQAPPAPGGYDRQIRRPTTSPYLNLLRSRSQTDFALQYYGIVRPELQFGSALNRQANSLNRLQQQVDQQGELLQSHNSQLGPTGHAVRFLELGGYFGTGVR